MRVRHDHAGVDREALATDCSGSPMATVGDQFLGQLGAGSLVNGETDALFGTISPIS
jgi:hypothetical protein